jgi:RND family efflux transporter MFP subunit
VAIDNVGRACALWLASALALAACGGGGNQPPASAPPAAAKVQAPVREAALTTVTLTPKALARTRTVGGEVMAVPGSETIVNAPFAGTLEAAGASPAPGTSVARGRTIFRLVPIAPAERDAHVDAERAVNDALARVEVATKKVQRAEMLARDGAGSRRAVEEAQGELNIATTDLKAARDRLALAERSNVTASGIQLEAPYAGLVKNVRVTAGQTVASGTPLFELVRLDTVWIRVPVYVGESDDIDRTAPARIVGLGDPQDAEGQVARPIPAPPSADPATAAVDLYFALANRGDAFRPGQRVSVRLTRKGENESLVVPRASLLHDAFGGTWVYEATEPHVYVRRRVAVADLVGMLAVLEQGPAPGVRVVTGGAAELFGTEFGAGK